MRASLAVLTIFCGISFLACASAQRAPIVHEVDRETREHMYAAYALRYEHKFMRGNQYHRADGTYDGRSIGGATVAYPEVENLRAESIRRTLWITGFASAGGSTLGVTALLNAGFDLEAEQLAGFYGAGAALSLIAVSIALAWRNPAPDVAWMYNRALRRDLKLPADDQPQQSRAAGAHLIEHAWRF